MNVKEKGMQKKVFIAIAAVAAVAIVALVLILALGRKEETYRSIKIIELEGGVTIDREGVGVLEASSNMNLISGDAVKTEQDAYAVLQLDSDKYVMLAESGSMTVVAEGDEANGRTAIQLDSGSVLSEIQNPLSSGSSYDIVTPNATMSVRGTVFEVRRSGDDSNGDIEVLVYDGKVAVGLDGMESALYGAGEYTKFTAGKDPQFVIERAEITDEYLNPQFMERLEQINSQSRELNLGTAQLVSSQTAADEELQPTPAATPAQTEAPPQAASPKPEATPAVTPKPAATPKPQNGTALPSVTAPAAPVVESPAVDSQEPDDDDDDEDEGNRNEADNSGSTPPDANTGNGGSTGGSGNTGGNGNSGYQDLWKTYTMAVYEQKAAEYQQSVSDGNAAAKECTVVFYLPYVVKPDGSNTSTIRNDSPGVYKCLQVRAGSLLTKPENPVGNVNYSETALTLETWCLEDGTKWNFDEPVKADMCLYPVWNDGGVCYFPVICRSAESWGHYHYCNCVRDNTSLGGITLSDQGNKKFVGWERINQENQIWNGTDKVQGVESLKASWSN